MFYGSTSNNVILAMLIYACSLASHGSANDLTHALVVFPLGESWLLDSFQFPSVSVRTSEGEYAQLLDTWFLLLF